MPRKSAQDLTSPTSSVRAPDLETLPPRDERTYLWVTFSKGDKNAQQTAFAGLNGQFFNYPRGKKCLVPKEVIEGPFADALQTNIETHDDNTISLSEESAFPYQVHGEATPDEVSEYFSKGRAFN